MDSFPSEVPWQYWLFAAAVGALIGMTVIFSGSKKKPRLPPSPGALPIVGSFPFLGGKPGEPAHWMFARLSEKFGPIAYLKMGAKPVIIVSSSEVAKLVLKDLDHVFASRPPSSAGKYMGMNFTSVTFAPAGPYNTRMRKIFTRELLGPKRVTESHAVREKGVYHTLGTIYQLHKKETEVNLSSMFTDLGLNLTLDMIFGREGGKMTESMGKVDLSDLKAVIEDAQVTAAEFNVGDFITIVRLLDLQGVIKRMKKIGKRMTDISAALIEEYERSGKKSPTSPDATILDRLLSLEGDDKLTTAAMAGPMFDLIIGGSDTSAASADWTIAELLRHPELVQRLHAELDDVVGKDRFVMESDLSSLPFLQAVVKESLRLHPPGALVIPHFSVADCTLAGYDIPAGTTTIVNLWAISRDPKQWHDPLQFSPDRFFNQDDNISPFGSAYHLLPFSSGRRGCPGSALGFTMLQLIVASFMHAFNFQPAGELTSYNDIDVINEKPALVSKRAQDLCVSATPRLSSSLYEEFLEDT